MAKYITSEEIARYHETPHFPRHNNSFIKNGTPQNPTGLDHGYGRGGTPVFTGVFEPVARVTLYLTDENGLGTCFGAA